MKRVLTVLALSVLCGSLGCNNSEPGGPGARSPRNENPITGAPKNDTFKIEAPMMETGLKQGEQKEVELTVDRSKDFKQDVTLTFKSDKGITVTPSSATVKASSKDTKVRVMVEVDKNAPIGEAKIHVTGKPETGDSTSAEFTVKVKGA
jgi:hypothetical protein